jgi:hypothetical protein
MSRASFGNIGPSSHVEGSQSGRRERSATGARTETSSPPNEADLRELTARKYAAMTTLRFAANSMPGDVLSRLSHDPLAVAAEIATHYGDVFAETARISVAAGPAWTQAQRALEKVVVTAKAMREREVAHPHGLGARRRESRAAGEALTRFQDIVQAARIETMGFGPLPRPMPSKAIDGLDPRDRTSATIQQAFVELDGLVTSLHQSPPNRVSDVAQRIENVIPVDENEWATRLEYRDAARTPPPTAVGEVLYSYAPLTLIRDTEEARRNNEDLIAAYATLVAFEVASQETEPGEMPTAQTKRTIDSPDL